MIHLPKTSYSYYNYNSYDNMTYKTINVTSDTYDKLVLYKHGNMSFDDVINEFMKIVEEKKFYNHILKEHRKRMLKIKTGDFIESDNLKYVLKKSEESLWDQMISFKIPFKVFIKSLTNL